MVSSYPGSSGGAVGVATDINGAYAFDASLFFETAATGFGSTLTASASGYFQQAGAFTTYGPPFPVTRDFNLLPSSGIVLEGTVTDRATGQPLAGASVFRHGATNGFLVATTDTNGRYTIDGSQVPTTSGPLTFQAPGHFVVATSYNITTIPATVDVSLLGAPPVLQGTVRDSITGQPIASAACLQFPRQLWERGGGHDRHQRRLRV